jgi:hypothetical protein
MRLATKKKKKKKKGKKKSTRQHCLSPLIAVQTVIASKKKAWN